MSTFSITTARPEPRVDEALTAHYAGNFYRWSDNVAFVTTSETARELAAKVGVKSSSEGEIEQGGITDILVVKVAPSYWGFSTKEFWEWLRSSLEGDN